MNQLALLSLLAAALLPAPLRAQENNQWTTRPVRGFFDKQSPC
jgi:hypothetical protein